MNKYSLTQEQLKTYLSYDADTGIFKWVKKGCGVTLNSECGGLDKDGYVRITINYKNYMAHQLAWLYVYGEFPKSDLDHENSIKNNNRIKNLRLASEHENALNRPKQKNNTSGYKCVYWFKPLNKWRVQTMFKGKNYYLGYFDDLEDAANAYKLFCVENHGQFSYKGIAS